MAGKEKKTKKAEYASVKEYKKWRNIHYSLKSAPYASVAIPLGAEAGVNWSEWFGDKTSQNHVSIGFGLGMAIVTTLLSVLAIAKKDSDTMKKIGPYYSVGVAFLMWGFVFYLLSSIAYDAAFLLIYAGAGILAAAIESNIDAAYVKERYEIAKKAMDDNGLSKKGEWKQSLEAQAKKDGATKRQQAYE